MTPDPLLVAALALIAAGALWLFRLIRRPARRF